MLNKPFPAFMQPVRTSRQRHASHNQYAAYQRLAAIYLLRLALGLQKSLRRTQLSAFFEDDVGRITGLDEFYRLGDGDINFHDLSVDDKLPFLHNASKAALVMLVQYSNVLF
jgi:hypothetical protein